jgi:hypothetical protein
VGKVLIERKKERVEASSPGCRGQRATTTSQFGLVSLGKEKKNRDGAGVNGKEGGKNGVSASRFTQPNSIARVRKGAIARQVIQSYKQDTQMMVIETLKKTSFFKTILSPLLDFPPTSIYVSWLHQYVLFLFCHR